MRRDESFGLGAIHADDELLDRLGRRDDIESFDDAGGLEALLAQWTAQIDADAESVADRSGPWGLRGRGADGGGQNVVPIVPRTVRIPMSRAAAIAGALAITMSGGGVAAALTGQDVPLMSKLVASARPTAAQASPTSAQPVDDVVAAAIGSELRKGQPQKARAMVDALKAIVGSNPDPGVQAKVDLLDQQVEQAEVLAAGAPVTTVSPTDLPSSLGPTTIALGLPSSPVSLLTTVTSGPLAPTTPTSTEQPPVVAPSGPSLDPDEPREGAPTASPTGRGSVSPAPGTSTAPSGSGTSTSDPSSPSTGSGSPSSGSTSSPTHGTSPSPSPSATSSGVRPTLPTPSAPVTAVPPSASVTPSETTDPIATPSPTPTPTAEPPSSSAPGGSTSVSPTSGTSSTTGAASTKPSDDSTTTTTAATRASKATRVKTLTRGGTSSQRVRATAPRPVKTVPTRVVVTTGTTASTTGVAAG